MWLAMVRPDAIMDSQFAMLQGFSENEGWHLEGLGQGRNLERGLFW